MFLAVGVEGSLGFSMVLLGSAIALLPKFNGSNIPLAAWEERLESAVCLYQVPAQLVTELAIKEDDARHMVMVLPKEERASLEQITSHLKGLFGEKILLPWLRKRFILRAQPAGG